MNFVRGDSFPFKTLVTYLNGNPIKREDISTLFVTCRQYANINYPILFQKTIDDVTIDEEGYIHVIFNPKDTENLDYGQYYFDIEITLNSGYRKSFLNTFQLTYETTIHTEEVSEEGNKDGN